MGRKRLHPAQRFLTVVSIDPDEGARLCEELHARAKSKRGRPYVLHGIREAITLADFYLPRPPDVWRRSRGQPGKRVTPRREEAAAWALQGIFAERGAKLTIDNATRKIGQAIELLDEVRAITPEERQTIEQARSICADMHRSSDPKITKNDIESVRSAVAIIQRTSQRLKRDQELLDQIRAIQTRLMVH